MSSTGITSPVQGAIRGATGNGGQTVQIINLPDALQNSARAVRLEGQITSQNQANNSVRIETPQGNVDVRVQGNRQPQVGQRVEIDIPANNRENTQVRQATIRTDPTPQPQNTRPNTQQASGQNAPQTQPAPAQPPAGLATRVTAPNNTQAPPAQAQAQTTTNQATPSQASPNNQAPQTNNPNTANLPQAARNITPQTAPPILQGNVTTETLQNTAALTTSRNNITPESIFRLISTAPAQAQNIAREFINTLPQPISNTINRTAFTSNLLTQSITTSITQTPLLQTTNNIAVLQTNIISNSLLVQTPQNATQNTLQNTAQNFLNNNLISQTQPQLQTQLQPASQLQTVIPQPASQPTTLLQPNILNTAQPLTVAQTSSINATTALATNITAPQTTTTGAVNPTLATPQVGTLTPISFNPSNPTQANFPRLGQIDIQIIRVTPPNTTLTPPPVGNLPPPSPIPAATPFTPPLLGANTAISINAQVTGFTPQGLPLITVQGLGGALPQSFILQTPNTNLQLGSQLQIIPRSGIPIAAQLSPVVAQTFNNPLLQGFQWPAINELYSALQQLSPQAAASLTRALPNAASPVQIAAAANVFIAAVQSGNFDILLGDKKNLLQQAGRSSILSGLTQDSSLARAPEAAIQSDWRAVPLPMFWEGEIHKITLYTYHQNQSQQQEENENGQTRFIFDLNLSRMGDVQIDGLVNGKRLDLIVRTQNSFSEPMQQTIRQSYTNALSQADLTGELNFQGSTNNWVHVLQNQEQLGVHV